MVLDDRRRASDDHGTTKKPLADKSDDPHDDCCHWIGKLSKR